MQGLVPRIQELIKSNEFNLVDLSTMQAAAMRLDDVNTIKRESAFESVVAESTSSEKGKYKAPRGRGSYSKRGGGGRGSDKERSGGTPEKSKRIITCGYCEKQGHYADKCNEMLAMKKKQKESNAHAALTTATFIQPELKVAEAKPE